MKFILFKIRCPADIGKNLRVDMSGLAFPSRRAPTGPPSTSSVASSAPADSPGAAAGADLPDATKKINFGALFGVGASSTAHRRGPSTDAAGAGGGASTPGPDSVGAVGVNEPVSNLDSAIDKGLDKAKAAFAKFGNIFGTKPQ